MSIGIVAPAPKKAGHVFSDVGTVVGGAVGTYFGGNTLAGAAAGRAIGGMGDKMASGGTPSTGDALNTAGSVSSASDKMSAPSTDTPSYGGGGGLGGSQSLASPYQGYSDAIDARMNAFKAQNQTSNPYSFGDFAAQYQTKR